MVNTDKKHALFDLKGAFQFFLKNYRILRVVLQTKNISIASWKMFDVDNFFHVRNLNKIIRLVAISDKANGFL